jgi:RimJ/RimL family protein N-acetyltransferase
MFPPTLHTPRLTLRPPQLSDAQAIFDAYAQDREVTRHLIWAPHRSVAETDEFLRRSLADAEDGKHLPWVITTNGDERLIGMIALRPNGHKADVGYVLARSDWGKGYMTEALRAVIEFAFTLPNMRRVWAVCDVDNVASARVMEKAGMEREGIMRKYAAHSNISSEPRDVFCYSIVR